MTTRAFRSACLLAVLLVAGTASGAEPAPAPPAPTAADATGTGPQTAGEDKPAPDRDSKPEPDAADEPSPEVFVPSEEISEDFTVSFPVDI